MEDDNTTTTTTEETLDIEPVTVIVLLIAEISAIACTILIFLYFFFHWRLMIINALHHHAILLLIIISFLYITLDLPFIIRHYLHGQDKPKSESFCLWWYWIDYTILCISLFLTATASIQRHILIFHSHWLHRRRRRWLLHYIPLILCILYPILFYLGVMYIYSCESLYDDESLSCPYPCYTENALLNNIDWILNTLIPVILILIANVTLFIRVMYSMKKIRRIQRYTWKQQKKLSSQLFAFTSLYVIVWTPTTLISLVQSFIMPNLFDNLPGLNYLYYMIYFVCPIQVFIYLFTLPKLMKSIKTNITRFMRKTHVVPAISFVPVHRH